MDKALAKSWVFLDIVFQHDFHFCFCVEETVRDPALSWVGGDQAWHTLPTSMMYLLVPQLSLWKRVNNIFFSYHSSSMPKGNKHFTVVILWPWGRMGLKRSTRISQGRPQTCNHQHPCPSVASFRAPTNNNGCLHNRLLAVTVRGLLCFGCPSSATWTSENQWVHLSHRHFLWL